MFAKLQKERGFSKLFCTFAAELSTFRKKGAKMAWKLKYRCRACGYEAEVYEGRGLFRQQITPMSCPDCKSIQNIVVGGIIADVAPSYRSEVGRLCLQCGSDNIRIWDMKTCPKCRGEMEDTGEKEFWT
jgi:Zn finger protein HypA/HybF involved in hydrogenase expression